MDFNGMLERFLDFVKIDTQSDENSESFPSTKKQLNLAEKLVEELNTIGLKDVTLNKWGYVFATLDSNVDKKLPTIALISHMDTAPDVSGKDVFPKITKNYNGGDIILSEKDNIVLKVKDNPYLAEKKGKTIITTSGNTLLGADDKAGLAEILSALEYLVKNPDISHPRIRVLFTPDEEIGKGVNHVTKEEIDADYAYTVDGEKLGEIEDETFCADTADIIITGVNVHPGYAKDKLLNAVKIAADIIEEFPKDSLSPETTEKREGYIHPYSINGFAEKTSIKVLLRDFEEAGLREKEDFIRKIIEDKKKKYPKAEIELKVTESYRNMKIMIDKHPKVIELAVKAIENSGIKPIKNIIRGGTDGARLSFMGLPTPNIFTGGSNFHSKYEWIALEDMYKASEVLVNLMRLWAE